MAESENGLSKLERVARAIRNGSYKSDAVFADQLSISPSMERHLMRVSRGKRRNEQQRLYYRNPRPVPNRLYDF